MSISRDPQVLMLTSCRNLFSVSHLVISVVIWTNSALASSCRARAFINSASVPLSDYDRVLMNLVSGGEHPFQQCEMRG